MRALACLGDLTTFGKITSATSTWLEGNKPIAQRGDLAWCSKCNNTFPIYGTADDWFEAQPYVATGDKVLCRCPNHVVYGSATQYTNSAPMAQGSTTAATASISSGQPVEHDPYKRITKIYWSYGESFNRLDGPSKHYVDLNIHVETENYKPGESIVVNIGYSDGDALMSDNHWLELVGMVDSKGEVFFRDVFKNKTLNLK